MTNSHPVEGIPYPLMASRVAVVPNAMVSALGIGRAWLCQKVEASA